MTPPTRRLQDVVEGVKYPALRRHGNPQAVTVAGNVLTQQTGKRVTLSAAGLRLKGQQTRSGVQMERAFVGVALGRLHQDQLQMKTL